MKDKYFIDTNIIFYCFSKKDEAKRKISNQLVSEALLGKKGLISNQVVQEFINIHYKKNSGMTAEELNGYLQSVLFPLMRVFPTAELYKKGIEIKERTGFSFYDALIVGSAIEAQCGILYSEDLQEGRVIERLRIVNPFRE